MPGWNLAVELGTTILRNQLLAAFSMKDVTEMRRYLDTLVLAPRVAPGLKVVDSPEAPLRGTWFIPQNASPATLLYLHGGGFAFYPRDSYSQFISLLAQTTRTSTFALDYRLSPEHRFPDQLTDVRNGYLALLATGVEPGQLVVGGDSAGGNLTLALLCDLRDRHLPLPALGIALSPATEFDAMRPSMAANEHSDWILSAMALTWSDWYCSQEERAHPLVSPIHADLRNLPPIYIQAGRAEILYDSITAFAAEAKRQGADVTLESWPSMNHVFQFFGNDAPQSAAALRRLAEVISEAVHSA